MMDPDDQNPVLWRFKALEERTGRIEGKLDAWMERVDDRFEKHNTLISDKLDEMRRELQLARLSNADLFSSRREVDQVKETLQSMDKESRERAGRINLAIVSAAVSFIANVAVHFLPSVHP